VEIFAFEEDNEVHLEVMDQGQGIPEEIQQSMFEPFFTTKQPGEGTGLGLSMAHKIIQEHNGRIEVDSISGVGTRIAVHLPRHTDQQNHALKR